jgi:N-methylhydantoinase A
LYKVAVDIGGTFTDCVIVDHGGRTIISKAPTNADDPSIGVFEALASGCMTMGAPVEDVLSNCEAFIHGCTIATNAIIERTGAKTAFITTKGHEDMLLIGKLNQKVAGLTEMEIIHTSRLTSAEPPLVPRDYTFGVSERVLWNGEVLVNMKVEELTKIVEEISKRDVESVAICLLWSFMNPKHERRIKQIIAERLPDVYCSLSSEVSPTFGEYERATATVINAYVGPRVKKYLDTFQVKARKAGYSKPILAMQCEGGTTYAEDASKRAVLTIDSGPVGGIAGGKWLGQKYKEKNLICTDVGGTSFDVGLIYDGEPQHRDEPVISKYRFRIPKVDIQSIGAGGGSIAWVDVGNVLRVGPKSAHAYPGPACYGRGGEEPTVTDADLVLGYLNPEYFLGGALRLDKEKAKETLSRLATKIRRDVVETAYAIFKIMNAQMADLIRKCTVERGFDPRNFSLIAYGGAGPTHVAFYGADVGAKAMYVLPNATVFSAFGMLTSPITHYSMASRRMISPYSMEDCRECDDILKSLTKRVLDQFEAEGISGNKVDIDKSITMRYQMQVHEVEVDIKEKKIAPETLQEVIIPRFEKKYEEIFGSGTDAEEAGTEVITCKVRGRYHQFLLEEETPGRLSGASLKKRPIPKGKREAFFEEQGQLKGMDTDIFRGEDLSSGDRLIGPSIVERYGDAIVIPPGYTGEVDSLGTISLTMEK